MKGPGVDWLTIKRATASVDSPLISLPVAFAQQSLQDLPGRIARKLVDEFDRFRDLETRQPFSREMQYACRVRRAIWFQYDEGLDRFTPPLVRHTNDGDVSDIRVSVQGTFDLGGVDVLAAGNDHVLQAIVDIQITFFVQEPGIAGMQPTVPECPCGVV